MKVLIFTLLIVFCLCGNEKKQEVALFEHLSEKYSESPLFSILNLIAQRLRDAQLDSHRNGQSLFGFDN